MGAALRLRVELAHANETFWMKLGFALFRHALCGDNPSMSTSSDTLSGIRSKIEWTKKHVCNLEAVIQAFLATNPYRVGTEFDPESGELHSKVTHVEPVPSDVAQISSDALSGMVSVLDHLAYRLWLKSGMPGEGRHVYFPIGGKATTLAEHMTARKRKVEGLPVHVIAAMDAIEPYKGGKGHQLWVLNELNNLSKHRDLIAVGAKFTSCTFSPGTGPWFFKSSPGGMIQTGDMMFKAQPARCPLQIGDVVFTGSGIAQIEGNPQMNFGFEVALNEPQIIHAKPLVETVHQLLGLVDSIVNQFALYL
jgi:hypothetical protein